MIPVFRLGYATFNSKDVEAMINYYINVLGCVLVERNEDHYTLNIIQGKKSYMHHIALQLRNPGHTIASYHLDSDKHVIELNIMEPSPSHKDNPLHLKTWESFEYWETQFSDILPNVEDWTEDRPIILPLWAS